MAYKTFFVRGGISGSESQLGNTLTLWGKFSWGTATTLKDRDMLVITTGDSRLGLLKKSPKYLYQSVTSEEFDEIRDRFQKCKDDPYARLEICLEGRGLNNRLAYAQISYPE